MRISWLGAAGGFLKERAEAVGTEKGGGLVAVEDGRRGMAGRLSEATDLDQRGIIRAIVLRGMDVEVPSARCRLLSALWIRIREQTGRMNASTSVRTAILSAILLALPVWLAACGGDSDSEPPTGTPSVTTSTVEADATITSASAETNSEGEVLFDDSKASQAVVVQAIDGVTNAPVEGITVHFASDGRNLIAVAEDAEGRYAPSLAQTSYDKLVAYGSATDLVLDIRSAQSHAPAHAARLNALPIAGIVVVVLIAIETVQTGSALVELAVDLPTLLKFSVLSTTVCIKPSQLENIVEASLGIALFALPPAKLAAVTKKDVVVALLQAIGSELVNRGIIATVTQPVAVEISHLKFLPVVGNVLPLVDVKGPCATPPATSVPTPPPTQTPTPPTVPPTPEPLTFTSEIQRGSVAAGHGHPRCPGRHHGFGPTFWAHV